MASPSPSSSSPFLRLPASIRQKIYIELLAPKSADDVTVVNYSLTWNWLEHPSNSTFAAVPQLDLCRCPQQPRSRNVKTTDHIYTRYKCYGPEVKFKSGRECLWVPSDQYVLSGQLNFLRPAGGAELEGRPNANILSTSKAVYEEAMPVLYRRRNFLFLTGPCPRGRYQAYATQTFLSRLSPFTRAHVTSISLVALPCEEDCSTNNVDEAYRNLATYITHFVPFFKRLYLNVWDDGFTDAAQNLGAIFGRNGVTISLITDPTNQDVVNCQDAADLQTALSRANFVVRPAWPREGRSPVKVGDPEALTRSSGAVKRKPSDVRTRRLPGDPSRRQGGWKDIWDEGKEPLLVDSGKVEDTPTKLDTRTELRLRKVVSVKRVLSTSKGRGKARQVEAQEEEEEVDNDDEWVDAALSPTTDNGYGGDAGSWEVI